MESSDIQIDYTILFPQSERELIQQLESRVLSGKKTLVAFSFFSNQLSGITKIVKNIRSRFPRDIFIMAGGPHVSALPESALEIGFDLVVQGEGEAIFTQLLARIAQDKDFSQLAGIGFLKKNGQCQLNPPGQWVNLDHYCSFSTRYRKIGPLEITRGCPFACNFCATSFLFGTKPRHRSLETIHTALVKLLANNIREIRFLSPNALSYGSPDGRIVKLDAVEELLHQSRTILGKEGKIFFGTFPSEIRPEQLSLEALQILQKYISNTNISIGGQSGSDNILEACHRGHTVAHVYKAVDLIRQTRFKPVVDVIFGFPDESEKDSADTLKMINDLIAMGAVIHAHSYQSFPGTPWSNRQASEISKETLLELEKGIGKRQIFGNWKKKSKDVF